MRTASQSTRRSIAFRSCASTEPGGATATICACPRSPSTSRRWWSSSASSPRDSEAAAHDVFSLVLSSPDRIYRDWREKALTPLTNGIAPSEPPQLARLLRPSERGRPVVTVIDGASHALSFVGGCLGVPAVPLGVDRFGQAGSQPDLYAAHDLSPDAIATAALVALELAVS